MASSSVHSKPRWASGFCAPLAWFFTATRERSSLVVPYSAMWALAIWAYTPANVVPERRSHSVSPETPSHHFVWSPLVSVITSYPPARTRSAMPDFTAATALRSA